MTREHGYLQSAVIGPEELVPCGLGIAAGQLSEARRLIQGGEPRRWQGGPWDHISSALSWMQTVCEALT